MPRRAIFLVLLAASLVMTATAWLRSAEYDEQYTLFVTAGPRPVWPAAPFSAGVVREIQAGSAGFADIARELRGTDVHPPLYFWTVAAWRRVLGDGLFVTRLGSVLCGLGALGAVGVLAWLADVPVALTMLLTLGCYSFVYTAAIARGFALAQMLTLFGVALLLWGVRRASLRDVGMEHRSGAGWGLPRRCAPNKKEVKDLLRYPSAAEEPFIQGGSAGGRCGTRNDGESGFAAIHRIVLRPKGVGKGLDFAPLSGGMLLGAATFTNYLAVFVGLAALLWLLTHHGARLRPWLSAYIGFAVWIPADLWFFLAQRGSRAGQFPPFNLLQSTGRLAQYSVAALFGGLPLYVDGGARLAVASLLALLVTALGALIAWRWLRIAAPAQRRLFAMCAIAPPVGLLLLGLVFNNTPIELRYLAFATPFVALLLAATFATLPQPWRLGACAVLISVQAAGLIGLATRAETMQPARATALSAAALADGGLVLLPRGNDGVGIVGAFANEAPAALRLLVINKDEHAADIRARAAGFSRVVLALLGQDADSRATIPVMRATFTDGCWREAGDGFNVVVFERICEEK